MWDSIRGADFPGRRTVQASDGRNSEVLQCSSAPALQWCSIEASTRSVNSVRLSSECNQCNWDGSGRGLLQDNVLLVSMGVGPQSLIVRPWSRN